MRLLVNERDLMDYNYLSNGDCALCRAVRRVVKEDVRINFAGTTFSLNEESIGFDEAMNLHDMIKFQRGETDTPFWVDLRIPEKYLKVKENIYEQAV